MDDSLFPQSSSGMLSSFHEEVRNTWRAEEAPLFSELGGNGGSTAHSRLMPHRLESASESPENLVKMPMKR